MTGVLIIVPAFNEQATISSVLSEIRSVNPDFDILVVNDSSTDQTAAVAAESGAIVASLPFNLRIGAAVQTGFIYASHMSCDIVAQVDGDGQHDPTFLPSIIKPLLDDSADIVIGSRYLYPDNKKPSFARNLGIRFFSWVSSRIIGHRITDCSSGFRALNRRAYRFFAEKYPVDFPDAEALILAHRAGLRIVEVPVRFRERNNGMSSLDFWRIIYYPFNELLAIITLISKKVEPAHD